MTMKLSQILIGIASLALLTSPRVLAQQGPPPLQPLLHQMLTGNLRQREEAFWTIKAIPHAASKPEVQRVFVEVLQREDDDMNLGPPRNDPGYGESYMEYVGWIAELVWRYAEITDSEDRATLLAIAESPGALPSAEGDWLETRTALHISDLLRLASSAKAPVRSDALQGLAKFLNAARGGKRAMTREHALDAKGAIIGALQSPAAGDRLEAFLAIEQLRDPDDAHYLAAMTNDPDPWLRQQARLGAAWLAKQPPVHHIAH